MMIKNGFIKKRVGTLTLGEKLKKIRTEKRISLGEISRATKIKISYLEALEEGDYDSLPADVYVKGFLRSYGDFFFIDGDILIRLYEKEKGIKRNLELASFPEKNGSEKKTVEISPFIFTPKKIIIFLTFLIFVSGLFYLYREIGTFSDQPRLVILSPQNNLEVSGSSVSVEGVTDKDAAVFINEQPVLVDDDGRFRESVVLRPGDNIINIKAVNRFQKEISESVLVRTGEPAVDGDTTRDSEGEEEKEENLEMEVQVIPGPVWLSVEADGKLVFSGTMLDGATQSFFAREKIILSSGRANATFVKFRGKDVGALGEDPSPVRGAVFDWETEGERE